MDYLIQSSKDSWALDEFIERGLQLPDWAENPPLNLMFVENYLQFFSECHTMRKFEGGPIPYDKLDWHGQKLGLDGEDLENHIYWLSEMDKFLLAHIAKEREHASQRAVSN